MFTKQENEASCWDDVQWVYELRNVWKLDTDGFVQRAVTCDSVQSEAETRITFEIQKSIASSRSALVVRTDCDSLAITLLNLDLRGRCIVRKVSDKFIYIDRLLEIL